MTNLKERFLEKFKTFLPDDGADRVAIDALPEDILAFIKQELELLAEEVDDLRAAQSIHNGEYYNLGIKHATAIIKNRIQEL